MWLTVAILLLFPIKSEQLCEDSDGSGSCVEWAKAGFCRKDTYVVGHCELSCGTCDPHEKLPKKYDLNELPIDLEPIKLFLGRWKSDFDGKVHFPSIPVFTYGETLDFSLSEQPMFGSRSLNYTSSAISINQRQELHSEYGFMYVQNRTNYVALSTVMNSGFTTVEEGYMQGNRLQLTMRQIGRTSFSRDLPVKELRRTFTFLDERNLEQVVEMGTLTHPLQEHTIVRYRKIYP